MCLLAAPRYKHSMYKIKRMLYKLVQNTKKSNSLRKLVCSFVLP